MKRQHGQSMVEFALIAPMIFLMIFGMIWGGYMFMEYLRFSNDVRAAARAVAVVDGADKRATLMENYTKSLEEMYEKELPNLYKPSVSFTEEINETDPDRSDAVVTVTFTRRNDLPAVLMWINFPPERIPALNYRMKIEGTSGSST